MGILTEQRAGSFFRSESSSGFKFKLIFLVFIILFSNNSRYSFLARGLGSRRTRRQDEEHAIGPASSLALCEIPTTAAVDLAADLYLHYICHAGARGEKRQALCCGPLRVLRFYFYLFICFAQS